MEEMDFRATRLLKMLGNPVRYRIVQALGKGKKTPGQLATLLQRPVGTISTHLAKLRALDVVRYKGDGKHVWYWLKTPETVGVLAQARQCAKRSASSRPEE